jgi:hypothetical protein
MIRPVLAALHAAQKNPYMDLNSLLNFQHVSGFKTFIMNVFLFEVVRKIQISKGK